eukprot:gene1293-1367_t
MFISFVLSFAILCVIVSEGICQNSTWTVSNAPEADWINVASDGSGQNLVGVSYYDVGSSDTGVYLSHDFGKTWKNVFVNSAGYGLPWTAAAIDSLGINIYVLQQDMGLYTSVNAGRSWEHPIIDSALIYGNYNSVAVSADGDRVYVTVSFGYIYTSNNFGRTFTRTSAPTNNGWMQVTTSGSGQYVAAVSDGVYVSSNYGSTWQKTSAPSLGWYSIHFSADGNNAVAAATGGSTSGGIYVSSDFGRTWTATSADRSLKWRSVTSDSTGQQIYAVVGGGDVYYSIDQGKTFQKSASAPSGESWRTITSDATGSHFSLASYNSAGHIYFSAGI